MDVDAVISGLERIREELNCKVHESGDYAGEQRYQYDLEVVIEAIEYISQLSVVLPY